MVMFPRQSGKNVLQAHIEGYLLTIFSDKDCEIVKVSPTWKPQTYNAMRRLEKVLEENLVTREMWTKERDYIYRVNRARIFFLSGSPETNIVGATASLLLEVDEAQDIQTSKFDKEIAPMAASTNATKVFWGTAWTTQTLLHREMVAAKEQETRDGKKRVFMLTADEVSSEAPEYGIFVAEQIAKLGRSNPMVKSQLFSEEIDGETGMFSPARLALIIQPLPIFEGKGKEAPRSLWEPVQGKLYAFMLDLAGEDEALKDNSTGELANPGRDSTALTIVEVDLTTLADPLIEAPTYCLAGRRMWTGVKHTRLYGEIKALAEMWRARYLVVDATGVGAGLASFLEKGLPGRVISFVFNSSTKSKLGWDFLSLVDTGRWKEWKANNENFRTQVDRNCEQEDAYLQAEFIKQLSFCRYEVMPGPEKKMKWGVPDGTRDPATGEFIHDDLVLSAALASVLDYQDWSTAKPAAMIKAIDPLNEMDKRRF